VDDDSDKSEQAESSCYDGKEAKSLKGTILLQYSPVKAHAHVYLAGKSSVLLDNYASTPIFCKDLVTDIKKLPIPVLISGIG